jgi:hypothetical protein
MTVEINPTWDRTGRLRVSVSEDPARLVVSDETGPLCRYELRATRPDRLGWVQSSPGRGRVTVADVLAHCLREWEAEQLVLELTERAARSAAERGPAWQAASARLRGQGRAARRSRRLAVLPFQLLFDQLSHDECEPEPLSLSTAALRAGFRGPDGRADTSRLERRLGLRPVPGRRGERLNRSVNYDTGLALCRALGRDPVELGL